MSPEYILSSVKWQGTLAPFWQAGPPNIFLRLVNRPSTFWTCKKYKSYSSMSIGIQDIIYCCCSVAQSCLTLCYFMDGTTPGFPVLQHLVELAQTHIHWVGDAIQPSHPLSSHSPPTFNLSQHQALLKWVNSSHQVAKVLEFQLQHQSFQRTPRTDFL